MTTRIATVGSSVTLAHGLRMDAANDSEQLNGWSATAGSLVTFAHGLRMDAANDSEQLNGWSVTAGSLVTFASRLHVMPMEKIIELI